MMKIENRKGHTFILEIHKSNLLLHINMLLSQFRGKFVLEDALKK